MLLSICHEFSKISNQHVLISVVHHSSCHYSQAMLVPVKFKEVSKWVRVAQTDNMYNHTYCPQFLQAGNSIFILISGFNDFHCLVLNLKSCDVRTLNVVIISISLLSKFNLPAFASLTLRDSAGVEVDSDIFD